MKRGYHFTGSALRNGYPIPAIGEWISVDGPIIPCESGLHMSEHPIDALKYAPGCTLHMVEIRGDIQSHGCPIDKWVGRERVIIATIDATQLLRSFARWCALQVVENWNCPEIVMRWLKTGDESIMSEARFAAESAARSAADSAARSAALSAARSAARSAADSAARSAALSAARSAAWSAADSAAWSAALSAARSAQREKLKQMVTDAFARKEIAK